MAASEKQRDQVMAAMTPSIQKQKASVRRQKGAMGDAGPDEDVANMSDFFVTAALIRSPGVTADCDPLSITYVDKIMRELDSAETPR